VPEQVRRPGRASKCTPENRRLICDGILSGLSLAAAAQLADIGESTVRAWMAGSLVRHRRFQAAVKTAQAAREAQLVARLTELQAHPLDPAVALRAVTFELERRHGWTKTQAVEVTGAGGGPVRVDVDPADAIRALAPLTGGAG
jgi:hypothetical protein